MIFQSKLGLIAIVAVLFACGNTGFAQAQAEADFEKLAAANCDALVTVKFVLRSQGGRDSEDEGEITAVMVSAGGLLLTSNSQVGGNPAFMRRGAAPTPTDIKVYLGSDDQQGLEARMVARDSELDLVWFQIKEPGDRKFAFIDFAKAASPKIGERLYTVVRLGKYFDRLPVVREGRVGALVKKPRSLVVPSVNLGALGQPIFAASGDVVGLSVIQLPDAEEIAAAASPAAFSGANSMILPSAEVERATKRALEADKGEESGDAATDAKSPTSAPTSDEAKK